MQFDKLFAKHAHATLIILLLFVYAFFGQGTRGLWKPDEGRYTCVALNMLEGGDWLFPRLNDEKPHFTKPPLTYWAIAASIGVFGRHEWAARIPSALAFFATVLLIAGMGRRLCPRNPRLPALIYASSPLVYVAANLVTTDTLLTLWETLAMFGFIEWWHRRESPDRARWSILMWAAFGLAFLTKGPPGLLPLIPIIVFTAMRAGRKTLLAVFTPRGLLLFALIGFFWYIVVCVSNPALMHYFIGDEVYGRIFTGRQNRNPEWYGALVVYLPILLGGALPWNLVLLRKFFNKAHEIKIDEQQLESGRLLMLWFLLPLAIFFIARSRLPLYLVPLFAPLSLILARQFEGFDLSRGYRRNLIVGWLLVLAASRIVAGMVSTNKNTEALANAIQRFTERDPREIVFVETSADYGLRFYLNAEVEDVEMDEDLGVETLAEELATREPGQIFIVRSNHEKEFLRTPPPAGTQWHRLGKYDKTVLYAYDSSLKPAPKAARVVEPRSGSISKRVG